MTEDQLFIRAACLEWMLKYADQFTHAVTLTLKPYRVIATEFGDVRQALSSIEAKTNFRHFLNRLNANVYGNAAKRFGKSITAMPLLEGQARCCRHALSPRACALAL